jgi:pimeloyl-ACP methyl ester carboxylesterase
MDHVEIDDLRVAFRSQGAGRPLLLLHGGLCDSRVFGPQLDDLCDQFRVIAWDAPGCGASSDPPEWFRLPDYADVLAAFVAALDVDRPHLLGHSWGSGLCLQFVQRHPSVPESLILAGAYAGWAGSLPPDEVDRRLRRALEIADSLPEGFDPTAVPGLFSDAMPPSRRVELVGIMSGIGPVGTRVMAHAFAEAELRDELGAIGVPTLLLHGADDLRSPLDVVEDLHLSIPGSELLLMPGLGHEAFVESPAIFNSHLRAFLERVDDQGP